MNLTPTATHLYVLLLPKRKLLCLECSFYFQPQAVTHAGLFPKRALSDFVTSSHAKPHLLQKAAPNIPATKIYISLNTCNAYLPTSSFLTQQHL